MRFKVINRRLTGRGRRTALIAVSTLLLVFIYTLNISSLPPVDTNFESAAAIGADSGQRIIDNVINAPQRVIDYGLFKLTGDNSTYFRLVSGFIALVAATIFFLLVKQWISFRVALLATILFGASSWVVHDARWAEPEAMLLLALPMLLLAGTLQKIKEYDPWLPITSFAVALLLYIPGFWLFFLLGLALVFSDLFEAWKELSAKSRALWAIAFALPLLPLAYGLTKPGVLNSWLGLSDNLEVRPIADNLIQLPEQLFVNGVDNAAQWLPGTPILDVVTAVLGALGAFFVLKDSRYPLRRIVLFGTGALALVLIGTLGETYISLLLPLVYIFVAFGIAFLLEQWFCIFPKNPMARSLGVVIVACLVLLTAGYHVLRYHQAWPNSDAADTIFKQ